MLNQIRERGVKYLVGIALCNVVPSWLLRFRLFTVYQLDFGRSKKESQFSDDFTLELVRCVVPHEKRRLAEICRSPDVPGEYAEGFAFQQEERWTGGVWLATKRFEEAEIGLTIEIPKGSFWLFSAYVDQACRRQGVYSQMLSKLALELPGNGDVFVAISNHNRASISAHHRFIKRSVAKVFSIRFLSKAMHFCSPKDLVDGATLRLMQLAADQDSDT